MDSGQPDGVQILTSSPVMLADLTVMSPVTVTTAYGHGMDETSPFLLLQGLLAERADDVTKESWAPGS